MGQGFSSSMMSSVGCGCTYVLGVCNSSFSASTAASSSGMLVNSDFTSKDTCQVICSCRIFGWF